MLCALGQENPFHCRIKILKVVIEQFRYFNYDSECDISYDADYNVNKVYQNQGLCRTTNVHIKTESMGKDEGKMLQTVPTFLHRTETSGNNKTIFSPTD